MRSSAASDKKESIPTLLRTASIRMLSNDREKRIKPTVPKSAELHTTAFLSDTGAFGCTMEKLQRFARSDHTILLLGERGSGKTRLGPEIHLRSGRASGPYVHVNLAAIAPEFMMSELFGHIRGAYTGAARARDGYLRSASGGTIFLDEIGKASLVVQRALLDVIEYKRYRACGSDRHVRLDVRIIFAANEDLDALVEQGAMTADFVDRLGLFKIRVPSMRERIEDIPGIVAAVLADLAAKHGWDERRTPRLTAGLFKRLAECAWLGNVRELVGFIELLVTEAGDSLVLSESLLVGELNLPRSRGAVRIGRPRRPTAKEVRRSIAEHDGNVTRAAEALGIGRTSLYRILGEDEKETPLDRVS